MWTQLVLMSADYTQLPDIRPPSYHSSLQSERNTRIFRLAAETWTRCPGSVRNSSQSLNTTRTTQRGRTAVLCPPLSSKDAPWWRYSQTQGYLSSAISFASLFRSRTLRCCDWMEAPERGQGRGPIRGGRVAKFVQSLQVWGFPSGPSEPLQLLCDPALYPGDSNAMVMINVIHKALSFTFLLQMLVDHLLIICFLI